MMPVARGRQGRNGEGGVTLIELVIVVAIIGILAVALGFQFKDWVARYRIESEAKTLLGDVQNARALSIARGRVHFVNIPSGKTYFVYEDTVPGPDGDGVLDASADAMITNTTVRHTIIVAGDRNFGFNSKGLLRYGTGTVTIRLENDIEPDADCLEVAMTRVNLGAWEGDACNTK